MRLIAFAWSVLVCAGALCFAPVAAQTSDCNNGQPVKFAALTWESAAFTTQVLAALLQDGYGCKTDIVPGTPAAIETALAQNDIQLIAEQWQGRSAIIARAVKEGTVQVVGNTLRGGARQGWYVPDYLVHGDPGRGIAPAAPDLKSWRDLAEYKNLFTDPEEPSKGRFLNCPAGWACAAFNTRYLKVLGLDKDFTNFRAGTGAALDSAISSAYDQGKPILFYYWEPAGLMAKYKFYRIGMPAFNEQCWSYLVSGQGRPCASDFLVARLGIAVSAPFAQANPELIRLFNSVEFEPEFLNQVIESMTSQGLDAEAAARHFLKSRPDIWSNWLPADNARRMKQKLGLNGLASGSAAFSIFPEFSATDYVNQTLMAAVSRYGAGLHAASDLILKSVLLPVERLLLWIPAGVLLLAVGLLAWHATRKPVLSLVYVLCLYAIGAFGLWDKLIQTFALVLIATVFAVIIGIPAGIAAARWRWLRRGLTPVLDVMQTLPSFVYLIPVLMFFGLGKVPAIFATVIYAVPPLIRLTILGLRQVDPGIMEAAQAFGVTRWQMLTRVTLPLARPSIMAGINQATMMALAMVVVASMIGARGLGEDVLAGIQTLNVGQGLQAGIAIVILAIVIDRITQAYGQSGRAISRRNDKEGRK